MPTFAITPARPADYDRILLLIQHVKLLTDDILAAGTRYWVAQTEAGELAGCAGIEFGTNAVLFRSLAVYEVYRGDGLARRLIDHALNEAQAEGYHHAYCFSTRAADYFSRIGFREVPGDAVGGSITGRAAGGEVRSNWQAGGERAWWKDFESTVQS